MNYYILSNNYSQNTSSTAEGVLAEKYDPKDPFPPMKYSWTKPRDANRIYPPDLVYIYNGEDKHFNLDYSRFFYGYIVSEQFKEVLDSVKCPRYKLVNLTVVNTKGEDISNGKRFYYIDMSNTVQDVIDYANSQFILDDDMIKVRGLTTGGVQQTGDYFGNIRSYKQIALKKDNIKSDILVLKDIVIHDLICNEEVYSNIRENFDTVKCVNLMDMEPYNQRFS